MIPMNGYLMLRKNPAEDKKRGIILPDGQQSEEIRATGYEVVLTSAEETEVKVGDTVFPAHLEDARGINGFVFCKASHIIAKE